MKASLQAIKYPADDEENVVSLVCAALNLTSFAALTPSQAAQNVFDGTRDAQNAHIHDLFEKITDLSWKSD